MTKRSKTIAVSGYFTWLHVGHLDYFREAAKYGRLVVIVNNDDQQINKYHKIIVPLEERLEIIKSIKYVSRVIPSIDKGKSVCETLALLKPDFFGNGGDRSYKNIPEVETCEKNNIRLIYGLGSKIQSSSWLMDKIKCR